MQENYFFVCARRSRVQGNSPHNFFLQFIVRHLVVYDNIRREMLQNQDYEIKNLNKTSVPSKIGIYKQSLDCLELLSNICETFEGNNHNEIKQWFKNLCSCYSVYLRFLRYDLIKINLCHRYC